MSQIKPHKPVAQKTAIMDKKSERRYMDTFKGRACECCGVEDGTVVPAHLNMGLGGTGYRATGAVAALCSGCHDLADGKIRCEPYLRMQVWAKVCQRLLLDRAREWKEIEG